MAILVMRSQNGRAMASPLHAHARRCALAEIVHKGLRLTGATVATTESNEPRWSSRTQAFMWKASGVGLIAFSGWLTYATFVEVRRLTLTPPEVAGDLVVRDAADRLGHRASFRILLFTDEFRWRLNSFASLENGSARPQFTPEMKAVLNDAQEIICVGTSSEELPAGVSPDQGRRQEERRAARRAEQIAVWVRSALSKPIPVRKLNIGHHAPTGRTRDTSDQRRVVIILVLDHDNDTKIDEALRAAMSRESGRTPIFDSLLTQYSLASSRKFSWIP